MLRGIMHARAACHKGCSVAQVVGLAQRPPTGCLGASADFADSLVDSLHLQDWLFASVLSVKVVVS